MRVFFITSLFLWSALRLSLAFAEEGRLLEEVLPSLPQAVSNNAVALLADDEGIHLFSMLGLKTGKTWKDISSNAVHYFSAKSGADGTWQNLEPVPGREGRLAASAVTVGGQVYVFGGYTVSEDGSEQSIAAVYRLQQNSGQWEHFSNMPVPVEDSVLLAYQDRYIYMVSGWHDLGNVNLVQVLDTVNKTWQQATPWPGDPVFGHAGGVSGKHLVVCDGVKIAYVKDIAGRQFLPSGACWLGEISAANFREIRWQPIEPHPGLPRYRMAAADDGAGRVLFAGGSVNPYNFNGIGYNGVPSEPEASIFSYNLNRARWECHGALSGASMDHRGLLRYEEWFYIVGGMGKEQKVSNAVLRFQPGKGKLCKKPPAR
jgi:N-acetylneuraminic acid mutarotase